MSGQKNSPARKGDLILVEDISRNHYSLTALLEAAAAGRTLPEAETTYLFGVVASATRDGDVKTWHRVGYGDALVSDGYAEPIRYARRWVLSAKSIDVNAVLAAAKQHHWPNHPGQPKAFDTFDEARAVAKPFARQSAGAA